MGYRHSFCFLAPDSAEVLRHCLHFISILSTPHHLSSLMQRPTLWTGHTVTHGLSMACCYEQAHPP